MTKEESDKIVRLYELYEQPMYRIAYAVLRRTEPAEDAVSDAFERIIRRISRIGDPESDRTKRYIVKVIKSTSINQYRKCARTLERERSADDDILQLEDTSPGPEETVMSRDSELLAALGKDDRELITMRVTDGLSWREAARKLGISESAARKRFERAKKRLAEKLYGKGE